MREYAALLKARTAGPGKEYMRTLLDISSFWLFCWETWLFTLGTLIGLRIGHPYYGALLGLLVLPLCHIVMLGIMLLWVWTWQPFRPPCRSGRCRRYGDYELLKLENGQILRCHCGTEYLLIHRKSGGMRLLEILPDGTQRPYMAHTSFGRWRPDSE
jgi:hypothetical protein